MHPAWILLHPQMDSESLGFIPNFFDTDDPRPAREQLDANYRPGGGWRPMNGLKMAEGGVLKYPGDPPMEPLALTFLRDEIIYFYEHCFVAIAKIADGKIFSYEVARMD